MHKYIGNIEIQALLQNENMKNKRLFMWKSEILHIKLCWFLCSRSQSNWGKFVFRLLIPWSTAIQASVGKATEVIGRPSDIKEGSGGLQSTVLLLEVPSGVCYKQHKSSECRLRYQWHSLAAWVHSFKGKQAFLAVCLSFSLSLKTIVYIATKVTFSLSKAELIADK